MFKLLDMMKVLDSIRVEKKITIPSLCEGICSSRSYSRYLSGESELSFDKFLSLVDRTGMELRDFAFRYNLYMETNHRDEIVFLYSLLLASKQEVVLKYYRIVKEKFKANKTFYVHAISVALTICDYLFSGKSKKEAHDEIVKILDYQILKQNKMIIEEEVLSLSLFISIASDDELDDIFSYFLSFIRNPLDYKFYFHHYDRMNTLICLSLLKILDLKNEINSANSDLKEIYNYTLNYLSISKQSINDAFLFEYLYKFASILGVVDKYFIFNYVSVVLSNSGSRIITNHNFKIKREEIELYYEVLHEKQYLSSPMYQGIVRL